MGAVVLRFYPNQKNPARESGFGVYRVEGWLPRSGPAIQVHPAAGYAQLVLHTDRVLKKGSRVDPRAVLDIRKKAA